MIKTLFLGHVWESLGTGSREPKQGFEHSRKVLPAAGCRQREEGEMKNGELVMIRLT